MSRSEASHTTPTDPTAAGPAGAGSRPARVAVLHGTNYWNMGDLGLMVALVQSLQRELPGAEIDLLSRFSHETVPAGQRFRIEDLGVREHPFLALPSPPLGSKWRHGLYMLAAALWIALRLAGHRLGLRSSDPAVAALCDADVIVSKPGGFIHSHMAPDHLMQIFLARLSGRPVVVWGQSIGPFGSRWQSRYARFVLRGVERVLVRDEPSLRVCRDELGLDDARLVLTADEAFLLQAADPAQAHARLAAELDDGRQPTVGMTVINWHFPAAADPAAAADRYQRAIVELIDHIHRSSEARVALFPFTLERDYGRNDEAITRTVLAAVAEPDRIRAIRETDPRLLKGMLGQLEAFVGSRMHSNIFAAGAGTPVLAIAYLPKTTGIMAMLDLSEHVVDINTLDGAELRRGFDTLWNGRRRVAEHLAAKLPEIRERAERNARITLELLPTEVARRGTGTGPDAAPPPSLP